MTKQKIRARNLDLVEIRPRQVNFDPIKQALPKVAKQPPTNIGLPNRRNRTGKVD